MASVRPRYLPIPSQDSPESGRLILRDGTTATIRVAQPIDKEAMAKFFALLSQESNVYRFFSGSRPNDKLIESFCDNADPRARLTLVVTRLMEKNLDIIAAGSYMACDQATAEIGDRFQGKGIGTLLLERLALVAVMNGFRRFSAATMAENGRMLDVFRDSGFGLHTKTTDGYIEIDLSVIPSEASVTRAEMRDRVSTTASVHPFFHPQSVAVVGASRNPANIGGRILHALITDRFRGAICPINPQATSVASIPAYPSLAALPEAPDLAIIAVPPHTVLDVIDDCAARGVKAIVVITAGFAETGAEGRASQQKLVEKVRGYGMRMVGPNCLGLINADPAVNLNASFLLFFQFRAISLFHRKAARSGSRFSPCPESASWGCLISSAWATRQMFQETTYCNTGRRTNKSMLSFFIWSPLVTRGD